MNDTLFGNLAGAWRFAVDYLRDRRQALLTMREFETLDGHEASRILAETGMEAADLREAVSRPFAFEDLMSKGMESVGIDPAELAAHDGDWFRHMQRNCAMCRVRGHCRQVLAHREFAARFHEFCPNSADFDRILSAGAGGGSPSRDVDEPDAGRVTYLN